MQKDIHPEYSFITVTLADGTEYTTRSTMSGDYRSEVDSSNHPFYTGKKTMVDTAGRVEKFMRRYGKSNAKQAAKMEAEEKAAAEAQQIAEAKDAVALGATTVDNAPVPGTAKPPASSPENPARDTEDD